MLICHRCGAQHDPSTPRWSCDCGGYLDLNHQSRFPKAAIQARSNTLWRYREALPVDSAEDAITLGEGMTPLVQAAGPWGDASFKLDFLMPTGSYKDRGTTVMMTRLREWGVDELIEDSSGNAGASVAAYGARAGIDCRIFIPAYTSAGKAAQIGMYGAQLVKVPGTREDTTRAAEDAAKTVFYASHNWSPYFVHGVKTLAFEIWEQLGWTAPESVVVPVGNGSLVLGLYQGFSELVACGEIDRMPRIIAAQSAACAPLVEAWEKGASETAPINKRSTMAEGIASAAPVKGTSILQAIRASNGLLVSVSEDEIWDALGALAKVGIYVEPTSATAPAAVIKLRKGGMIGPAERTVVELTGSGLKATDKITALLEERG